MESLSHVLRLLLILRIIVVIVSIVLLFRLFLLLCLFGLLLLSLLMLTQCLPLGCKSISLSLIIANDDVVKNGATFHLPQVKANETKSIVLVHCLVILVLRIINLLGLPYALVRWIRQC